MSNRRVWRAKAVIAAATVPGIKPPKWRLGSPVVAPTPVAALEPAPVTAELETIIELDADEPEAVETAAVSATATPPTSTATALTGEAPPTSTATALTGEAPLTGKAAKAAKRAAAAAAKATADPDKP